MANNLVEKVSSLFGVEIGEKFKLRDVKENKVIDGLYYFNEAYGLMSVQNNVHNLAASIINRVIIGELEVVKLPWEPKYADQYYFPCISNHSNGVTCTFWYNTTQDYALKKLGVVYRTEAEVRKNFARDYEKLTGKKWEEEGQ